MPLRLRISPNSVTSRIASRTSTNHLTPQSANVMLFPPTKKGHPMQYTHYQINVHAHETTYFVRIVTFCEDEAIQIKEQTFNADDSEGVREYINEFLLTNR